MSFSVGDNVYASHWCEGTITEIKDDVAYVEFCTSNGGGCLPFGLDELKHVPRQKNEDIKNMSNHELGVIAKAFVACGKCSSCPCDGILCGNKGWEDRKVFILEVAERLMERK